METRLQKLQKNKVNKLLNAMIITGIILVTIPFGLWLYETYYQWSSVRNWEPVVSVGSDDSIRTIKFKEQNKQTQGTKNPEISKSTGSVNWSPQLVDTSTVARGTSIALIEIPKIKIKYGITEGEDWGNLAKGPVRVVRTAKIGAKGITLISGHRTMYGAPFNQLHKLALGDKILIYTKKAVFVYSVDGIKRVYPDDWTDILKDSDIPRLALSTCDPMFSAKKRLLILAKLEQAKKLGAR